MCIHAGKEVGYMVTLFAIVTAVVSAKFAIEAFASGAILGCTLYTASRTNRVVHHRVKRKV